MGVPERETVKKMFKEIKAESFPKLFFKNNINLLHLGILENSK